MHYHPHSRKMYWKSFYTCFIVFLWNFFSCSNVWNLFGRDGHKHHCRPRYIFGTAAMNLFNSVSNGSISFAGALPGFARRTAHVHRPCRLQTRYNHPGYTVFRTKGISQLLCHILNFPARIGILFTNNHFVQSDNNKMLNISGYAFVVESVKINMKSKLNQSWHK